MAAVQRVGRRTAGKLDDNRMIDYKNYIIAHDNFPVEQDECYKALAVGGMRKDGWLCELDGDNIHEYNKCINECTGLYWIWKNTSSEYVGMSHYRRWFYNYRYIHDKSRLDAYRVEEILRDNDIILTSTHWFGWRVIDNCNIALGEELTKNASNVFFDLIRERQPYYLDAYCDVMEGNSMHICNLFVTRREIMDKYCEWLFSFLLDAADRIYVAGCTPKQKRVAGYFAETMWTVWLKEQKYKVHELPHRMVWE